MNIGTLIIAFLSLLAVVISALALLLAGLFLL